MTLVACKRRCFPSRSLTQVVDRSIDPPTLRQGILHDLDGLDWGDDASI